MISEKGILEPPVYLTFSGSHSDSVVLVDSTKANQTGRNIFRSMCTIEIAATVRSAVSMI